MKPKIEGMLSPCAKSRLKRKRVNKQTHTHYVTIENNEKQDVQMTSPSTVTEKENIAANNGLVATALVHPPQTVKSRATFILDNASLKKGLVKKALRAILDSPLNKAGMVGAIYVKIDQGALFEIKPHVRIPRTCKRFCGVIMELLQKSYVCAKDTNEVLLRLLEEPITRHLPANSYIVGLSYNSEKLVDIEDYVSVMSDDLSPVFVVGAMVNGKVKSDYTDDFISVSDYPLASKYCVGLICEALEHKWKIF